MNNQNKLKLNKNLINENLYYSKIHHENGNIEVIASSNKDVVDYRAFKSAYNPDYPDAGKIVKIPEDYLYKNSRHHLKDFVIIDGKIDDNGNQIIIGFLGTSQINSKTRELSHTNSNELIAITKVVVDKDKYKRLIKKSRTLNSNLLLNVIQLTEVKEQSKTLANINKSKRFRN